MMIYQYYTVREISEKLKVSPQAVLQWIKKGKLKAEKFGASVRIPEIEWEKFKQSNN